MERLSKIDQGDDLFAVIVPRFNAVVDAVNALGEIHGDGQTIVIDEAFGFCVRALDQPTPPGGAAEAAAGYSGPLKLTAIVDSVAGTAQAKLIYGANSAESFCGYYMHGGETVPIPVVTSENLVSGTNLIYLKLTVQTNGTLAYTLVTSNTAASQTVYQWIGNIVFDATAKTATVTQIHEGNLFLAGVI